MPYPESLVIVYLFSVPNRDVERQHAYINHDARYTSESSLVRAAIIAIIR